MSMERGRWKDGLIRALEKKYDRIVDLLCQFVDNRKAV
jgi:hypothetical protein